MGEEKENVVGVGNSQDFIRDFATLQEIMMPIRISRHPRVVTRQFPLFHSAGFDYDVATLRKILTPTAYFHPPMIISFHCFFVPLFKTIFDF